MTPISLARMCGLIIVGSASVLCGRPWHSLALVFLLLFLLLLLLGVINAHTERVEEFILVAVGLDTTVTPCALYA